MSYPIPCLGKASDPLCLGGGLVRCVYRLVLVEVFLCVIVLLGVVCGLRRCSFSVWYL
jgi:hypothetical protein